MKNKNIISILILLFLFTVPVFAENYDSDIYEDDGIPAKPSVSIKKNNPKPKSEPEPVYKPIKIKDTESFPRFEGKLLSELYINTLINTSDRIQEIDKKNNTYLYLESLLRLRITKGIFAETKWFLEPTNNRLYNGNFYAKNPNYIVGDPLNSDFYGNENHIKRKVQTWTYGLGVETLNIGYKNSNLALGVGKINPTFGIAFDKSRFSGIYGISMPEEYELIEKIGGYVSALFPFGNLTFNLFFDDTTGLSDTMFKNRGKNKSHGIAGNTEKLNNFSITFDMRFDQILFNIGFKYLDVESSNQDPEKGFVIGGEYIIDLGYNVNLLPLAEFAYLNNYKGMPSRNVVYFTTFFPITFENWHFIFTNTFKYDREEDYHNYTSHLTQLSVGYKFDFGLMFDVARVWERYSKKADGFIELGNKDKWVRHADSWAFMLSYLFEF